MNGIAISIVLGQIGKVFGFPIESGRIVRRLVEVVSKLPQTHLSTLAVGVTTFVVMRGIRRFFPRLPAPLIALFWAVVCNAAYFGRRVLAVADATPGITTLIVDGAPIVHLDNTGPDTIAGLADHWTGMQSR